jgi:hypothetical protein
MFEDHGSLCQSGGDVRRRWERDRSKSTPRKDPEARERPLDERLQERYYRGKDWSK